MATILRQCLLMLAVLLTAIGNMNMLSFCECNSGVFIGKCSCESEEVAHHIDTLEDSTHQPGSGLLFVNSHHCSHVLVANNDLAQITPTAAAQIVPIPQFIAPAEFLAERAVSSPLPCLREIHDPPDPLLDLRESSSGYCRPMLI